MVDGATVKFEVFEKFFACLDGFEIVLDESLCVCGVVGERGEELGKKCC